MRLEHVPLVTSLMTLEKGTNQYIYERRTEINLNNSLFWSIANANLRILSSFARVIIQLSRVYLSGSI